MHIEANQKFQKAKNVHWKSVGGEAVLLHFQSGDYYALDPVGTFLWSGINEKAMSYDELLNELMLEYNCGREAADRDLKEFCNKLMAENLLELKTI